MVSKERTTVMTNAERVIMLCDMDAYFASVEELFQPHLRDVPMAVCGDPNNRRGIIVAKNAIAKKFGVKTAETIHQALKKCPGLVLCPARHHAYDEYCEKANEIYGQYTDLLELASIDESFMDVTASLHLFGGDAGRLAEVIRERVERELGLTVSVGVSWNKVFAKMAADLGKPNAVTVVARDNFRQMLWPLPVGSLYMVGKATESILLGMNLQTIGDFAQADEQTIRMKLGKHGDALHRSANGLDTSPVLSADSNPKAQSIGNSVTFRRDLISRKDAITAIGALSDNVASKLRLRGIKCAGVQLTVKDPDFTVITRQKSLAAPTWLASDIAAASMALYDASWKAAKPVRLLAVTAMKLVAAEELAEQISLLESPADDRLRNKKEQLEFALDRIRSKYGFGSVRTVGIAFNDLGIYSDEE
ncbi:MAG: DNA polymerase IV [Clostridia bacterium]|nr:DNA polymerase IV [Clostridia bacterium]